jgi:hypothetical protein
MEKEGMLWRRPHQPPRNRSRKLLLSPEPSLGLGVKAPLRRSAALTPASLRLNSQCGSRWLPLLDERERPRTAMHHVAIDLRSR